LAEIGIFFKTIILAQRQKKAEQLHHLWIGTHVKYEGLRDIIKSIAPVQAKPKEPTVEEVNRDWRRLAAFMRGRK